MNKKPKVKFIATIAGVSITEQSGDGKKKRTLHLPRGWDGVKYRAWRDGMSKSFVNF